MLQCGIRRVKFHEMYILYNFGNKNLQNIDLDLVGEKMNTLAACGCTANGEWGQTNLPPDIQNGVKLIEKVTLV